MIDNIECQLRRDENEILTAYPDHMGFLTIGVGRLIDKRKGGGISREESAILLTNDLRARELALDTRIPWWRSLDKARQGVLLNMSFQMGVAGLLGFTNTLEFVRKGLFEKAADNMMKSLWADQTPERAKRLEKQMRKGIWV